MSNALRQSSPGPLHRAGYTILEVLIGVLVMAIGIVGVLAMQTTSVQASRAAYDARIATELAETVLERIQRDSLLWGQDGNPGNWGSGAWLNSALTGTVTNTWELPPTPVGTVGRSPTFNDLGLAERDTGQGAEITRRNTRFCVDYQAQWLRGATFARIVVRVRWPRGREGQGVLRNDCTRILALEDQVNRRAFYETRVVGVARMTPP
jgi:type II secretory pathway pseudopilin PulG